MARKSRRRTRKGRRRKVKRRSTRSRRRTRALVNKGISPVGQRYITDLSYVQSGFFSSGASGNQVFRLNSIYDPDRSGTGHQPYGRDTMDTLYGRYRVIGFKYRVKMQNTVYSEKWIVIPTNGAGPVSGAIDEIAEKPRARMAITHPYSGGAVTFSGRVNLISLNGCSKTEYNSDDRFQAQGGANPTEQMDLHIGFESIDGITSTNQSWWNVKLTYRVEFFDPYQLGQS